MKKLKGGKKKDDGLVKKIEPDRNPARFNPISYEKPAAKITSFFDWQKSFSLTNHY